MALVLGFKAKEIKGLKFNSHSVAPCNYGINFVISFPLQKQQYK